MGGAGVGCVGCVGCVGLGCGVTVDADAESSVCIGFSLAIATARPCDGPTSNPPNPAVAPSLPAPLDASSSSGCETWMKLELLSVRSVPVDPAELVLID